MPSCFDVAKYFLSKSNEEVGDAISNLKLQKLVYYAQGFSLALLGRPLFDETLEAWMHGPVVPALYRAYKAYGANGIPVPNDLDLSVFSAEQTRLLDEVYDVYGQYSAWKLRQLTHSEQPWQDNYIEGYASQEIPLPEMAKFFKENLVS